MENDKNIYIIKKNRFTLSGATLPEMFVKSVDINFIKKTLEVELYGVCDKGVFPCHDWLDEFKNNSEDFVLTIWDGYGVKLFKYLFHVPKLKDRTESFNYDDTDELIITSVFSFNEVERINALFGR